MKEDPCLIQLSYLPDTESLKPINGVTKILTNIIQGSSCILTRSIQFLICYIKDPCLIQLSALPDPYQPTVSPIPVEFQISYLYPDISKIHPRSFLISDFLRYIVIDREA